MSHVTKIAFEVTDLDCLDEACEELGLELVRGQTKFKWWGTHVGDYPLPAGYKQNDMGKCTHAIRVKNNSNAYEVGVVERKDGSGYDMLWDFYGGGLGLEAAVGQGAHKLKQEYSAAVSIKALKKQGLRVTSKSYNEAGLLNLELT
jgi:hypothetical protein